MMIDDQHLSTRLHRSSNRPMGGDAAINGDDQFAAFVLEPYQRRKVGSVAFTEAVGICTLTSSPRASVPDAATPPRKHHRHHNHRKYQPFHQPRQPRQGAQRQYRDQSAPKGQASGHAVSDQAMMQHPHG